MRSRNEYRNEELVLKILTRNVEKYFAKLKKIESDLDKVDIGQIEKNEIREFLNLVRDVYIKSLERDIELKEELRDKRKETEKKSIAIASFLNNEHIFGDLNVAQTIYNFVDPIIVALTQGTLVKTYNKFNKIKIDVLKIWIDSNNDYNGRVLLSLLDTLKESDVNSLDVSSELEFVLSTLSDEDINRYIVLLDLVYLKALELKKLRSLSFQYIEVMLEEYIS